MFMDLKEFDEYYENLIQTLKGLSREEFDSVLKILKDAKINDNHVFIIGNGGSSSTAEHYANDFLKIGKLKVFALTNKPTITAFGNDIGYDSIFVEQLKVILNSGDVLIGITGSGNSQNIVNALKYVKENNGKTIGILGFDGGRAKEFCDSFILVKSNDYGIIEDIHMTIAHYISRNLID